MEEKFNYNEINKRHIAPHLLKSYGIDIEKADTMKVKTKDMVDEHKKLINTLESESHKDDKEEAEDQKKELKEYEKKLNKAFETLGL